MNESREAPRLDRGLSPLTLVRYLAGDREAIGQVAACRNAWKVGLVFVFSAGLAREYDGESLLHEPWHLALPLAASIVTSLVLFLMVSLVAHRRGVKLLGSPRSFRQFLGLFWMMAPMAWLYAIPVERFMSPGNATAANMWLLGIVATWRVVLMIRVISVVFGVTRLRDAISTVMLFSDVVMLIAVHAMPVPVWAIMGGVRLTQSEQIILNVTCTLKLVGILSLPVWLVGYACACRKGSGWKPMREDSDAPVSRGIWTLAVFSVLIWLSILPVTQPEQQLRFLVERDLKTGQIDEALRLMSEHDRTEFPPHWDPPPRLGYREWHPNLYDVLESLAASADMRSWVRQLYVDKFMANLNSRQMRYIKSNGEPGDLERVVNFLERIPEARERFVQDYRELATHVADNQEVPDTLRERVRALAGLPEAREVGENPDADSEQ